LEDKSWAATDLCPEFRNWERWKDLMRVGQQVDGLSMKEKSKVDADSFVRGIFANRPGSWVETPAGMKFTYDDERKPKNTEHNNVIQRWRITSSKTYFREYEVIDIGTMYICECEDFKYHHKCKHIDKVKEIVRAENKKIFAEKQQPLL